MTVMQRSAKKLFEGILKVADRNALLMLNPLLARLSEWFHETDNLSGRETGLIFDFNQRWSFGPPLAALFWQYPKFNQRSRSSPSQSNKRQGQAARVWYMRKDWFWD